jgi:septum site-determining protein MinD
MGYVCAIAGGKGGVGKTTTAINLATVAAERRDVALLDADLGMANIGATLGVDPDGTLHDVLAGEASLADVIVDGEAGPAVVVGDRGLDAYAEADPAELREVVADLRADYDLVVIDTGAGLSHDGLVPLGLADGILLATTPDDVAVRDTEKTAALAERVGGSVIGVVLTRATPDTDVQRIAADLEYPVVGVVPEDSGVATRPPIVRSSDDAPAAAAFRRLGEGFERVAFEGASGADLADSREDPAAGAPERDPSADTSGSDAPAAATDGDGRAAGSAERDSPGATSTDDGDTDSGGVFGLFR